jgi:hypothetical protein
MSSRLEQFIRDHREDFDDNEPPKRVWDHVERQTDPRKKEIQPVIWLSPREWSVAAAVSLLIAGSIWYFSTGHSAGGAGRPVVVTKIPAKTRATDAKTPDPVTESTTTVTTTTTTTAPVTTTAPATATAPKEEQQTAAQTDNSPEANYQEEMGHYAGLLRMKHKELRTIEKDEPLLYEQFAGDIKKLDSVYQALEKQLPGNPNHEQLMEAMVQDLQLQMKLLNHQLDIIKQINHSKKTAYENAYKTI